MYLLRPRHTICRRGAGFRIHENLIIGGQTRSLCSWGSGARFSRWNTARFGDEEEDGWEGSTVIHKELGRVCFGPEVSQSR